MPSPARAGLFVYAKDTERIAEFYQKVVGMTRLKTSEDLIVIESEDIQLVIHAIPEIISQNITISSPPQPRENVALKFFFTVPNLNIARDDAALLGGEVFHENWHGPGFTVCNAMDPEGNIFQLRENLT